MKRGRTKTRNRGEEKKRNKLTEDALTKDELVINLRKEIEDYERDIKSWNQITSGSLYQSDKYCLHCYHQRDIFIEDMKKEDMITKCSQCDEFLPCEEWCVDIRGIKNDKCPRCN
jgi:hypothetical protein